MSSDRLGDHGPFRGEFFKGFRQPLKVCLAPGHNCNNPVESKAHSIQDGRILDPLSRNGYVIMPDVAPTLQEPSKESKPYVARFKEFSRRKATTFTGLCHHHDDSIFAPIENDNKLTFNSEQKFLLAYREVLRELHVSIRGRRWQERNLEAAKNAGPSYSQDAECIENLAHQTDEHERGRLAWYKDLYDDIYLRGRQSASAYGEVEHDLIRLPVPEPKLAATSTFFASIGNKLTGVVLTVLPHEKRHVVQVSYLQKHSWFGQRVAQDLMSTVGTNRLLAASQLILDRCENLVISPEWWDSLPEKQRVAILGRFFGGAAYAPQQPPYDAYVNLFEAVR